MAFAFLTRLFNAKPRAALPAPLEWPEHPPDWAESLSEQLQKLNRAQARLTLKVEDLDKKVEGGFGELRLERTRSSDGDDDRMPDELFDIFDGLDEASRAASLSAPELAQGIDRLVRRLESLLLQQRYLRLNCHGQAPDGRLFRVVGTTSATNVAEGLVAQVIRAAVTTPTGAVVREGEVLTSRRDA